ncbi:3-oxo-5-alpha-steroid 4-dehydrogenase [Gigaspora margarita]|uniref:3-oxo-5-alpha-steroid 4-dehydrogenase n=1 Tax=Gigaspora margarita TaxID=4874 RepID=A0A8H3XBV3_GIGMA|nr:3-oxo-5-alpha-steroid 4-dehydrogenase [Gigaspora margarita]
MFLSDFTSNNSLLKELKEFVTWAQQNEREFFDEVMKINRVVPLLFFGGLLFITAPYGKFQWNSLRLPGKFAWLFMESFSPIAFIYSFFIKNLFSNTIYTVSTYTTTQLILGSLWVIHYTNRVYIYAYRAPNISPIHILPVLAAIFYNIINGYTNARWISVFGRDNYLYDENGQDIYKSLKFILGVLIFLIGMVINIHHDNILFSLRNNLDKSTIKSESVKVITIANSKYVIPNGGLFDYIACPHYFGEIIEWIGFVIATWYSYPAVLFLTATLANLVPRAKSNLDWYREKFGDMYPKNRKAIIPFVW